MGISHAVAGVASYARSCGTTAAVVFRDGVPVARNEISRALIDYAQPGVAPLDDAQYRLYLGLSFVFVPVGSPRSD